MALPVRNETMYNVSVRNIEPRVMDALNKKFEGMHVYFKQIALMNGNTNEADYMMHADFFAFVTKATPNLPFGIHRIDVKTVTPKNNRGEATNFSIDATCFHQETHPNFFIFVLDNNCWMCRYDDVNANKGNNRGSYYLLPLHILKRFNFLSFTI